MTDKPEKLYVLVGHDYNNAFKGMVDALRRRAETKGDVELIYPDPKKTLAQSLSGLKPPANILIAAHGGTDATFTWNNGQNLPYSIAFAALPRKGISSVTISGCYGETSQQMAEDLPSGTVLQSLVGSRVPGWAGPLAQFGQELVARPNLTQTTLLLEALDNTDPNVSMQYAKQYESSKDNPFHKLGVRLFNPYKPSEVLPHTISIGGEKHSTLELDVEVMNLMGRNHASPEARDHFTQSVRMVQDYFDTKAGSATTGNETALRARIAAVGKKLGDGQTDVTKFSLEEKRIAYAITAAHLSISGELKMLVETAVKRSESPNTYEPVVAQWDGKGSKIVAQIQALAEASGMATDNGGPRDGKVSGIENPRTKNIIRIMEASFNIKQGSDPDHQRLLKILLDSANVFRDFAATKDVDGKRIVDVRLVPMSAPESPPLPPGTSSPRGR